jgi:UDP-GlcNAc:undecaprenyl-phosphate GlcNAc-1-phosphate transferase
MDTGAGFQMAKTIAPAVLVVFLCGLVDDVIGLKPLQKLACQVIAGIMIVFSGVQIHYVAGIQLHPWQGMVLTIVWLVGCANAVNLIDGLDGLAAGIALFGSATMLVGALLSGNLQLAAAVAPLLGALLGFLVFNFNPASIFLGDCGSLVLGFLLGCYGILWADKSAALVGITVPVIALSVPLLDTTLAIARRFLRMQPIFGADRSHIHHRLLARGFSTPRAVLLLYVAAGMAGTLALFVARVQRPWDAVIIVLFVCAAITGVNQLGYVEFGALRRLIVNDTLRRTLNGHIALDRLEQGLNKAATPEDCFTAIQSAAKDLGFHRLRMQFGSQTFKWHGEGGPLRWSEVRIPISERDWIELSHEGGAAGHTTSVIAFAETVRKGMGLNGARTAEGTSLMSYAHASRIEIKTLA